MTKTEVLAFFKGFLLAIKKLPEGSFVL